MFYFFLRRLTLQLLFMINFTFAKIIDYSHSDYIPILDGNAIVWNEYGYLRHTTNLTTYSEILDETKNAIEIFPQTHVKKILESDILHIDTLLTTLTVHHRHARSINFIGTALKVIAGTPDADDWEDVKLVEKQLVDSNNRQIEINTKMQIQIEKLTNAVNTVLTTERKEQIDTVKLFEILMARNRMMLMELQNLILSVTLAKANIVNPIILDQDDLKFFIKKQSNEQYIDFTISELMQLSKLKVILNDYCLHFIIRYPIPVRTCKKVTLLPVAHFNRIIQFADTNTVVDCEDTTYSTTNCQHTSSSIFCQLMPNTTCAQQLISGKSAHCKTQSNTLDKVAEIDDGIVVVNDAIAEVKEPAENSRTVNGTFLIMFEKNVTVNGTLYVNRNNIDMRKPGTPTFPSIIIKDHIEILSLSSVHEMNLQNLRYIGDLEKDAKMRPILVGSVVAIFVVLLYLTLCLIKRRIKKREKHEFKSAIEMAIKKTEDGHHLSEGVVSTSRQH